MIGASLYGTMQRAKMLEISEFSEKNRKKVNLRDFDKVVK